jgi:hypothetical protein
MYVKPEAAITVFKLLMMGGVSPKHVEQLKNIGIINSTTRSHLVGSFYEIYFKISFVSSHEIVCDHVHDILCQQTHITVI